MPKIIFEDQCFLVIEKPSGLVVNRARTVRGETLQDWIDSNIKYPAFAEASAGKQISQPRAGPPLAENIKNKEFINRTGLVHRLDKETSGLMVIAKEAKVFYDLQKQFKERSVVKKYLVLVHGKVQPLKGDIKAPIKRNPFNRFRFGVFVDGRAALTVYRVLNFWQKSKQYFSLVEVKPKTGRTHQIRVHFSHLRHPLVADLLYAGRKTARADRHWCPRLFLHASYLEFTHPETKKRMKFSSELPEDLQRALEKIREL